MRIPAKYAERQQMVLRKAVKCGVDGIIDLISQDAEDKKKVYIIYQTLEFYVSAINPGDGSKKFVH